MVTDCFVCYRSDNCIKNYYYSTLRKHLRRINKNLKQSDAGNYIWWSNFIFVFLTSTLYNCFGNRYPILARKLGLKVKNLSAEHLYQLVKERKVTY